ncbi:putative galactose oxidase/kelch, beta-propeller [Medicago truncatula]|uniref:Putative galactose oxidase/kelch, beta-propeller n=1 Tax=Medicago truncatula TaxID=3880 RepID=G7KT64_MEDTR|nr:hypothetical protein MTR_7g069850 [Medicago truncatula]RHN46528.1 putative galactose oxidase/kelch, beta-propeller [Medicago truncatula]
MIMKRLPLKDYLRLRAICRSCRETVSNIIENKHCCPLPEMPSLSTKSLLCLRTPLLKSNKCIGSVEGWLIVVDNSDKGFAKFFFLNPVTDVRITIPSKLHLPSIIGQRIYVRKMTASSKPNCDGSDCYLVGLLSDYCHIAIYKLFEKSWTIVEPDKDSGTYFTDIEIIGRKLYVIGSSSNSILVYDLKDSTNGPPKAQVLAEFPRMPAGSSSYCIFLAKDKTLRELYFISMFYNCEIETQRVVSDRFSIILAYAKPPHVTCFEVFKLDTNKSPIGWQNVRLDDKVVFLSCCKSMVISRDELNNIEELVRGNSIYFAVTFRCPRYNPSTSLEFGMFCLNDSSIKYFPEKTLKHGDVLHPVWFVPSLW